MRDYLLDFLSEYEYPRDAQDVLISAYDKIMAHSKDDFSALISEYEASYNVDYDAALERMKAISKSSDVHEYTGALILFLAYTRGLSRYYEEQGIAHEIYRNTVLDLRYKLDECRCVKGVWGSFVARWFAGFFKLERFALGRLQFEIIDFGAEYDKNGLTLHPDSKVLNVHIPRTGTRLDRAGVLDSYRLAADFYRHILGEKIVFVCNSWLLFPRHRDMLKATSNLIAFMNDYDVFAFGEYSGYGEIWRLFDVEYDGDLSHLPADTSLRRAYVDLISRGEKTGWGRGVFEYKKADNYPISELK